MRNASLRHRPLLLLLLLATACGAASPSPGGNSGGGEPPPRSRLPPAPPGACVGPPPVPDAVCVQDCGPPVAREGDPPPGYSWLTPEEADNRANFGCPICLAATTRIATPAGERLVSELVPGAPVYTMDAEGRRVEGVVLHVASTPVPRSHRVVRVALDDGRSVVASPGHPLRGGTPLGEAAIGSEIDGARVIGVELSPYDGERTWDLVPSGPTGVYWADGVPLATTLRAR